MGNKQGKSIKADKILSRLKSELKNEQEPEIIEYIKKKLNRIEKIINPWDYIDKYQAEELKEEIEQVQQFKCDYENKRILKKIDEEIKIWESIKSCNYSDKSVIFNKNVNVDEILKQLNKYKQEKIFKNLETWPLSVGYKFII